MKDMTSLVRAAEDTDRLADRINLMSTLIDATGASEGMAASVWTPETIEQLGCEFCDWLEMLRRIQTVLGEKLTEARKGAR